MADMSPKPLVVAGLEFAPLPEGWMAIGGFIMLKCMDPVSGNVYWMDRTGGSVGAQEMVGQFICQADLLRQKVLQSWTL